MEKWGWLGDHLAIDLANTVRRRGMGPFSEVLRTPADVEEWLARQRHRLVVPTRVSPRFRDELVELRDAALGLLRAHRDGRAFDPEDVALVNSLVRADPTVTMLGPDPERPQVEYRGDPDRRTLAECAAAVVELFARPDLRERIAYCDAPGCGGFWLRSRPNQLWCGPPCGARARAWRHAHLDAAAGAGTRRTAQDEAAAP